MNPSIDALHPYPFQKLADLLAGVTPNPDKALIKLTIGEPQHDAPAIVLDALRNALDGVSTYPATKGSLALRQAIANWAKRRFSLPSLNPDTQVVPVTGTREALFAITQALVGKKDNPLVISPNPFYQIYEGATILAKADLKLLPCSAENNYQIDYRTVSDEEWSRCELLFS